MNRRGFVQASSMIAAQLLASGCSSMKPRGAVPGSATAPNLPNSVPFYDAPGAIVPIRADLDRIFRITVCLRPFRAAGPRQDVERVGDKLVVHNYGHGGSGWSLSWGSADVVIRRAMEASPGLQECAVLGCGALGLTAALTAQRMGLRVTIYAKERPPYVRSSRATGSWTPDSRVALTSAVAPDFASAWEKMARTSFSMYQSYLGMAGTPIEWTDRYWVSDEAGPPEFGDSHGFVHYNHQIADLTPHSQELPPGSTPFPTRHVRRNTTLTFNVSSYARGLVQEFQIGGGHIETREFHTPAELAALPQTTIINCTGYGAHTLWSDQTIVPIRGQIAWLIPQERVNYGLQYKDLYVLARRDGIVIQPMPQGDDTGWNDDNEQSDRAEAERGVRTLQELYARMQVNHRRT
jgi:glycine/D-amino acid oxidase-like deaminating enzyme